MKELSHRNRSSTVVTDGRYVYKTQPKYLTDNEFYALLTMLDSGYVPRASQIGLETIRILFLAATPITDVSMFMSFCQPLLDAMKKRGLRHGDLTSYSVIPVLNRPMIIDWAESRMLDDPRPDKRPEGDAFWLRRTMESLCTS